MKVSKNKQVKENNQTGYLDGIFSRYEKYILHLGGIALIEGEIVKISNLKGF
ncbi:Uncharacterised protein [uncultured archaeon]|nr:Uncharacterised protein [uncultured archaeon]